MITSLAMAVTVASSRRLLLHFFSGEPNSSGPTEPSISTGALNPKVEMITAILLCAFICALGIKACFRFALRLSGRSDLSLPALLAIAASRRRAIRKLPVELYDPGLKLSGSSLECAICLGEIVPGQRVRRLPNCGHGFHVRCVDRWLQTRPTCPTCRQCLFTPRSKISACVEPEGANRSVLEPLEPEGLELGYLL